MSCLRRFMTQILAGGKRKVQRRYYLFVIISFSTTLPEPWYITMHGLRHSYASMLITLKRPIMEISRYLGHKDVSVTMRIYAHVLKLKEKDTMTDLARMINGA